MSLNIRAFGRAASLPRRREGAPSLSALLAHSRRQPRAAREPGPSGGLSGVTETLSLFLPGTGQLVLGRGTLGLFFLSMMGFCGTLCWAILTTLDRLGATLPLLGLRITAAFWFIGVVYVMAATVHLSSVLTAAPCPVSERRNFHPAVSGVASLIVPGWGQVLNGDRVRAGLLLAGVWAVAAIWVVSSSTTLELLNLHLPVVTALEEALRRPHVRLMARWTAPIVLWCIAVYDAASSAHSRRV